MNRGLCVPGPGVAVWLFRRPFAGDGGAPQLSARWLFFLLLTCSPNDDDVPGPT